MIPLPFRQRVRLQRANIYAISGLLILGVVGHWVSTLLLLIILLSITAILFIPARYLLTEDGLAMGRTPLRRWIEFRDVELRPGRVHLFGAGDWRDMDILIPTTEDGEQVLAVVRRALLRQRASASRRAPKSVDVVPKKASAAKAQA
jgi:hypothetical protein